MFCYHCMRDKGDASICPYCGKGEVIDPAAHHLPPGTVVGGRYTLGRVLGEGGFGITYLGYDSTLEIVVAVKEYFPYGISHRVNTYSHTVSISAGEHQTSYDKGKQRFLNEATNLARFSDEPGIVKVINFIEENNTAYIVMEYLDGTDLRQCLRQYGPITMDQALMLLMPVIKSLDKIHRSEIIHRDISPDNLMYLNDGSVKLMDFGAARDYSDDNRSMSVMLKKGYAPEEQYRSNGKQGPWTDVYGMCATIYRCVTGQTPEESLDRVFDDRLKRPSEMGITTISPAQERVLMYGLAVRREDRCQSMAELYRLFEEANKQPDSYVAQPVARPAAQPSQKQEQPVFNQPQNEYLTQVISDTPAQNAGSAPNRYTAPVPQTAVPVAPPAPSGQNTQKKNKTKMIIIIAIAAVVLIAAAIVIIILASKDPAPTPTPSSSVSSATSSSVSSHSSSTVSSKVSSSSKTESTTSSSSPSSSSNKAFSVSETSTAADVFSNSVAIVFDVADVSEYDYDISGSSDYPLSSNGCYVHSKDNSFFRTELRHTDSLTYDLSDKITIEGKTYTINTTTLQDLLDDGWKYRDDDEKPEANASSYQSMNMNLNGKRAYVYIESTGSNPNTAKVIGFSIYINDDSTTPSFNYHNMTNSTTPESAYENGTPSTIEIYAGSYLGTIEYQYNGSSYTDKTLHVEFSYNSTTGKTELSRLAVR